MRNSYNTLFRKSEKKELFVIPRREWKDTVIMDLSGIGCEVVGWIHLAQDRNKWRILVTTVMKVQVI
jgi:hypothetical protein